MSAKSAEKINISTLDEDINEKTPQELENIKAWVEAEKAKPSVDEAKKQKLDKWLEEYEEIKRKTKKELHQQATQLTGNNLDELKISRSDALVFGKQVSGVSDPIGIDDFILKIKNFQRENNLVEDGKIGKDTFIEMKAKLALDKTIEEMEKKEISNETMKDIRYVLNNGNPAVGSNIMKLLVVLKEFKGEVSQIGNHKNTAFLAEIDSWEKKYKVSSEYNEALKKNSDGMQSIYGIMKDDKTPILEKVKKITTDPTLLMAGGLLFLFGVVGGDSKYTDSFFKRLGWVVGTAMFGSALWNKIGIGEMIQDVSKSAESGVLNELGGAMKKGVKSGQAWVEGLTTPEGIGDLGGSISGLGDQIKGSYISIMGTINDKNELNKTSNHDKYITDLKEVSTAFNNDKNFTNYKIEELEKIKGNSESIKPLLSSTTMGLLFPSSLSQQDNEKRNKDLLNYVDLILGQKKDGDIYVSDILLDKSILDEIKTKVAESNVGFTKNTKANEDIKTILGAITDEKVKNELISLLGNFLMIEDLNDNTNYNKLVTYLAKNPDLNSSLKSSIESIKVIFLSEEVLRRAIVSVSEIKLENSSVSNDSSETINRKVALLEKLKTDLKDNKDKLNTYSNSDFEKVYLAKKLELFQKGAKLEVAAGTSGTYTAGLPKIQAEIEEQNKLEEIIKKTQEVTTLETAILEVPASEATLGALGTYLKDNFDSFKKAKDLYETYKTATAGTPEEGLKARLEVVLKKAKTLYEKIKTKKEEFKKKIDDLNTIVNNYDVQSSVKVEKYQEEKQKLKGFKDEYDGLKSELDGGLLGSIQSYFTGTGNIYAKLETKLKEIDGSYDLDSNDLTSSLSGVEALITSKKTKLKSNLNLDLNFALPVRETVLSQEGVTAISEFMTKVKQINLLIPQFFGDEIDDGHKEKLKEEVNKLIEVYVSAINSETDLDELNKIKVSYKQQVIDNISWVLGINSNAVEKAYEKKVAPAAVNVDEE